MRQDKLRAAWIGSLMAAAMASAGGDEPTAPPPAPASGPATDAPRDDELAKKLMRKATTGTEGDLMSQVTTLMTDAENRLVRDLDSGPQTQATQQRILQTLDEAIKTALMQRTPTRSRGGAQGERREMPKPADDAAEPPDKAAPKDAAAQGKTTEADRAAEPRPTRRGEFRESRRGWGHLPQRDRDELLQGIDEEFIEQYRPQIEQYYRALTETEDQP